MTDEVAYFCPRCQGTEIERVTNYLATPGPKVAKCKLCGWEGYSDQLIGALNPENETFWTGDRVANALLMAATKYAAGPMVQVLELIGLIPRIAGSKEQQKSARQVRDEVMRELLEAVVTSAFESAAQFSPPHFERWEPRTAEAVDRILNEEEPRDEPS